MTAIWHFYSSQKIMFWSDRNSAFLQFSKSRIFIFHFTGSVDPNTVLLLTNAVYFSEAWTVAFKPVPEPAPFTLSNGEQVQVKMMTRSSHEIVTAAFKFKKKFPDMTMFLVTLRYSVSTLLMLKMLNWILNLNYSFNAFSFSYVTELGDVNRTTSTSKSALRLVDKG